ncbi:GNAT family N-acetyltransferase [Candidatus Bathyarchaeota archaeon]|nr:GNAT family N-acetyltransferase [Candidatus Bathyarchaeota archaeon]
MVNALRKIKRNYAIEIRDATIDDVDDIWEVFNIVVEEGIYLPIFSKVNEGDSKRSWFYDLITSGDFCLVATLKQDHGPGKFLGQVIIETTMEWDGTEHVATLGILVHPSYRNMGVGRALIDEAIIEARNRGKLKITLSVFHTNARGINLYKKLGFEIVGCREKQFDVNGTLVDEVLMEKWLVPKEHAKDYL